MTMTTDEDDASIVRSTVELARRLRLRVVAEGVEDDEAWRLLPALDCDVIQGHVLARPLPAEALSAWLAGYTPPDFTDVGSFAVDPRLQVD